MNYNTETSQFHICIRFWNRNTLLDILYEDIILICYGHHQDGTIQFSFQTTQLFFPFPFFCFFFGRKSCRNLTFNLPSRNGKKTHQKPHFDSNTVEIFSTEIQKYGPSNPAGFTPEETWAKVYYVAYSYFSMHKDGTKKLSQGSRNLLQVGINLSASQCDPNAACLLAISLCVCLSACLCLSLTEFCRLHVALP